MVEKLVVKNETLVARMTRGLSFNAKAAAAAGFSALPPLTNGRSTGVGLSSLTGSRCSTLSAGEQQTKRSVIALKSAPGPTVNSSGTGLLKTKSHGSESRGPRSRKRWRDYDVETLDSSDKRDETGSACELAEPSKRRRRGKGSKQHEIKNTSVSMESDSVLHRSSSNGGAAGLLDIYGLKTRTVDLAKYQLDIPLEKLLSGDFEVPQASAVKSDPGESDCRNLIEGHLGNVMDLLPKRTSVCKSLADNEQEVKGRFVLDLERPFQPEDDDTIGECAASSTTTSKPFYVEDLPLYTYEDFRQRLKLPSSDLASLISSVCPTDFPVTTTAKSSKFEGIPPFPFSFPPCGIGEAARASRHGRSSLGRDAPDYSPRDNSTKSEPPDRAKEEKTKDGNFRINIDAERILYGRHLDCPAMPSSPGVQEAAMLLCNMANSDELDERECSTRGKRHKLSSSCEQQNRRCSKTRLDDRSSQEAIETSAEPSTRKSPGMEKRKSLSQVNHSLSCKRPSHVPNPSRAVKSDREQQNREMKDRHSSKQQQQQQQQKSSITKSTKDIQFKPRANGLFDRSSLSKPSKTPPEPAFKSSRRTSSLLETRKVRSKHDLRGSSSSSSKR